MTKGLVFNIQRYSLHDGPGIRTVVFLKGCPLRCLWCQNPESQNPFPEVAHRNSLCTRCARCVEVCEPKAVRVTVDGIEIDRGLCTHCGKCVAACITGALKVYGYETSVEEVFREVIKDDLFYRNSGGGVTVSGGEPLSQADFAAELFQRCRSSGIHTAVETCGMGSAGDLEAILEYSDLVLYDLKLMDLEAHRKWTGGSNDPIRRNFEAVLAKGIPVIVRVPLIPGITDTTENLRAIGEYILAQKTPIKVELMPYHRLGVGKYEMLDRKYELGDLTASEGSHNQSKTILESLGLECEIVV